MLKKRIKNFMKIDCQLKRFLLQFSHFFGYFRDRFRRALKNEKKVLKSQKSWNCELLEAYEACYRDQIYDGDSEG